eukprot:TRINITY_DN4020_c1_g1_i1.p1 TRINITY_DN4020_c1_g1~~TRINITY_DN4020_c1_g1_i1.p1  ORF type:complete len:329 (+),score=84.70 TRINITY_DN4020_c1_g1_i1:80-1066(+)
MPRRGGLTADELAHYHKHGYVIVRGVLGDEELGPLEADYTRLIGAKAEELKRGGHISSLHEEKPFAERLAAVAAECSDAVVRDDLGPWGLTLDTMYALQPGVFQLFFSRSLLDCVESIVGPEITLNPIQHLRPFLPARHGEQVRSGAATLAPWHQDQGVTREEADASEILTCFTALCDIPKEAGCLQVIPDQPPVLLEHVKDPKYGTTINPVKLPQQAPVDCDMRRGDLLFMNRFTPHRTSRPNTTRCVRWSLDMRFQRTGTPTGRHFWPEFVVRSKHRPAAEQRSIDDWRRRWRYCLENSKGERWHRVAGDVGGNIGAMQPGVKSKL